MEIAKSTFPVNSCRNTRSIISYMIGNFGHHSLDQVFNTILEPGTLVSTTYTYRGNPLDIAFFEDINNWFPNDLMLKIFHNLDQLGVDPVDLGRYVIRSANYINNVLTLALVQMLGVAGTIRKVNDINALFNKTKTVKLVNLSSSGGQIRLSYAPGVTHNEYVTQHNLGVYLAVLEYIGLEEVVGAIDKDDFGPGGCTILHFSWKPTNWWIRARWLFGFWCSKTLCRSYLRTEHSLNMYHSELIESFRKEVAERERSQAETDRYYKILMHEQEDRQRALKQMVDDRTLELQSSLTEKEHFFENISHEFKTPLTLILGHAQLMAMESGPEHEHRLQPIENNARVLQGLVEQLLQDSEQKKQVVKEPVNLTGQLQQMMQEFEPFTHSNKVRIRLQAADELFSLVVLLSQGSWHHIAINLLSNALKHAPAGSEVLLQLQRGDSELQFTVVDSGPGFTATEKEQMLQRYHTGMDTVAGNGLGLSIIDHFVSLNGGSIEIRDNIPNGAKVIVRLPLKEENLIRETPEYSHTGPTQKKTDSVLNKACLLLVEDNPEMCSYLYEVLADQFELHITHNGVEALEWLDNHTPELILSDVMMPRMDGYELCHKVKSEQGLAHVPFVLLSAKGDVKSQKLGYDYAADDYIAKPFAIDLLIPKLNNMIATLRAQKQKLIERLNPSAAMTIAPQSREEKFVDRLNSYLEQNFADAEASVSHMAQGLNMSTKTLNRRVQGLLGRSPSQLLREYRLQVAHEMLRKGHQASEVAYSCGFSSQSYFTKCYKELYGHTPSKTLCEEF